MKVNIGGKDVQVILTTDIPEHYNYDTQTIYCKQLYSFNYYHEYAHAVQNTHGLLETIDRLKEFLLYFVFYTFLLLSVVSVIHYMRFFEVSTMLFQLLLVFFVASVFLSVLHALPEIHANWYAYRRTKK